MDGLTLAGIEQQSVTEIALWCWTKSSRARVVPRREGQVNSSLTTVTILVTLIHVAALGVMIWIRVRRSEADVTGTAGDSAKITPCAVCGQPAIGLSYDGLDPNERRDPSTGRAWSADMTHYRPRVRDLRLPEASRRGKYGPQEPRVLDFEQGAFAV